MSDPGTDLVLKSLEKKSFGIRLLNVHREGDIGVDRTHATVYVPRPQRSYFLRRVAEYANKATRSGKPKNMRLVNSIADIQLSVLESFWQDPADLLPGDAPEWVEVWLSSDTDEVCAAFSRLLGEMQISRAAGELRFPERCVLLIKADRQQLTSLIVASDDIAEYRRAKEITLDLVSLENKEQLERVTELLGRTHVNSATNVSICILDTGINNGHLLIQPVLATEDCHTVAPSWGTNDDTGHGTKMAGVAAYGKLIEALSTGSQIRIEHRLESAKILPPPPTQTAPELWGHVTAQGISRAEIQAPYRQRITCLAATSTDSRDHGRPSSWSAMLDELASGATDGVKRLIIVSAGNVGDSAAWLRYPDSNLTDEVHDPGQAWNALTVGAYTELVTLRDPMLQHYRPVAPSGGLSPFSTTSVAWRPRWPIKPDVVFEGGNAAAGPNASIIDADDLSVLSLCHQPAVAQFVSFNKTSAAAANAAWMAARIQTEYPEAWPETIRALIVHSASWTPAMRTSFLSNQSKAAYQNLLRACGYGVPDLEDALHSASNSLTLISQAELQPYDRKQTGQLVTRDMHLYSLPWPREVLREMQDTVVQMRVTLSYFVEPGPGEVGRQDRYRYPSFGLRYAIKGPAESRAEFAKRVNAQARDEGDTAPGPSDTRWVVGSQSRHVGSVHSDIWSGTAADLAESYQVAVFPTVGWWRERSYLGKWGRTCRYALVVSIKTPPTAADIYVPVAALVGIQIPT